MSTISPHNKILDFLRELRNSHPTIREIYLKGSCYNLYIVLKTIFPQAEVYYDGDHIITLIDKRFYDIRGEVLVGDYLPFEDYHTGETMDKIKKQLYVY